MTYKITLNGKTYEVVVEKGEAMLVNEYDAQAPVTAAAPAAVPAPAVVPAAAAAPAPAAAPANIAAGEAIEAPMPGLIVGVKVSAGQAVKSGQVLIVLEAMKMENDIVAPRDGTVAQVLAAQGQSVDTGAALVVLS